MRILLLILVLFSTNVYAQKWSSLTEHTPTTDDQIADLDNPSGIPVNKKTSIANLFLGAAGMTVNGSSGNVGVGSTAPGAKVDVQGTVRATAFSGDGSALTNVSGTSSGWSDGGTNVYVTTTSDTVGIGTTTANAMLEIEEGGVAPFMVSSSETTNGDLFLINSGGNIGIGTQSPETSKVMINTAGGTQRALLVQQEQANASAATQVLDIRRMTSGTAANNLGVMLDFSIEDDAGNPQAAYRIAPAWTDVTNGSEDAVTNEIISLNGTMTTQWTRTSNGWMYFNVNTQRTPEAPIDVLGEGNSTGITQLWRNSSTTIQNAFLDNGSVGIGTFGPTAHIEIVNNSLPQIMVSSTATAEGDLFIINSDGNVGIGSVAPNSELVVNTNGGANFAGRFIRDDSSPNSAVQILQITRRTSGTAANNLGSMLDFAIEDDAGNDQAAYRIAPAWEDVTNGSEDAYLNEIISLAGTMTTSWTRTSNGWMSFNITTQTTPAAPIDVRGEGTTTGPTQYWRNSSGTIQNAFLDNGSVGIGTFAPVAKLIVTPPTSQTIAAGNTITADACGTVKRINAGSSVTTSTTDTFTTATTQYNGCCMDVVNEDSADTITLDFNANTVTNGGADVVLGPGDTARFCSNGVLWRQIGATGNN